MNYDGLKDNVTKLLAGERVKMDIGSFSNDMTTFHSADDVLTLLVHLGYLAYDFDAKSVLIPNSEVAGVFATVVCAAGWNVVAGAIGQSEQLLQAIWDQNEKKVTAGIEAAHLETSILAYNDENSLSCTISLALYSAREYYFSVRELPAGNGFADIVYIPRKNHLDKPAMVVELKWDKAASGAIAQIKDKKYLESIAGYSGEVLLVGINYDRKTKIHECEISYMRM